MAGASLFRASPGRGCPRSPSRERGNRPSAVRIPTLSQSAPQTGQAINREAMARVSPRPASRSSLNANDIKEQSDIHAKEYFAPINEVYVKYFPTNWPARMFLCVQPWAGRFDVEMTCVAADR